MQVAGGVSALVAICLSAFVCGLGVGAVLVLHVYKLADARIERAVAVQGAMTSQIVTDAVLGGPPQPVEVDRQEALDEKLQRVISEETMATGVTRLREEYAKIGMRLTDEELRDEVMMLASGLPTTRSLQ